MAVDYKKIILLIGIALVPFYEILMRLFPDVAVLTPDTRVAKSSLALLVALLIGLAALYHGVNIKVSNKWFLALLAFIPISINRATSIPLVVNGMDSSSFWLWKPFVYILAYTLMFLGVKSINLTITSQKQILKVLYYTAIAMAFYITVQYFGVDQFYAVKPVEQIGFVQNPNLIGSLGQPTLVTPFLGLGLICAISLRKYLGAVLFCLLLGIINSKMAIGASIVSVMAFVALKRPRAVWVLLAIGIGLIVFALTKYDISELNGRNGVYKQVVTDWKTSATDTKDGEYRSPSFTGIGLGSYGYLFPEKHKTTFKQAHSDPLEILYCLGLIGLFLYMMANFTVLHQSYLSYTQGNTMVIPFMCCFLLLHLVSCGTFIFQLGVYQYLGVMLFGILSNQSLIGRE